MPRVVFYFYFVVVIIMHFLLIFVLRVCLRVFGSYYFVNVMLQLISVSCDLLSCDLLRLTVCAC